LKSARCKSNRIASIAQSYGKTKGDSARNTAIPEHTNIVGPWGLNAMAMLTTNQMGQSYRFYRLNAW
jgi:hypothetical protein